MATIAEPPPEQTRSNDAQPSASRAKRTTDEVWQLTANVATVGIFALLLLAALYLMRDVIVPVILAWVVANILLPVVNRLETAGVPRIPAVIAVALMLVGVIFTVIALLSLPLTYWVGRATELGALLRTKLQSIGQPLDFLKEMASAIGQVTGQAPGGGLQVEQNTNILGGIFSVLTPAVSQGILFLGALIFYMIYQQKIKTRSVLILPTRTARLTTLKILSDIERNTTVYFGTFTVVNICLGIVTTIMAYAVGLPNPMLWGVLAAVLNYIPYIGVAVMVGVLFLIGLFTFTTTSQALIAPLIYVGITTIEGHFLTPTLMGRRMTMNPFAVFLAIGFWTWMWGPIGAFVSVPILMTATVIFRHLKPVDNPELP